MDWTLGVGLIIGYLTIVGAPFLMWEIHGRDDGYWRDVDRRAESNIRAAFGARLALLGHDLDRIP